MRTPALFVDDSVEWLVGTRLPARPNARFTSPIESAALFVWSNGHGAFGPPPAGRWFLSPVAARDPRGRLHVVWGEPDSAAASSMTLQRLSGIPAHSVWHAVLDPERGWLSASRVFERPVAAVIGRRSRGTMWRLHAAFTSDASGRLHLAFEDPDPAGAVVYMRNDTSGWTARRIPGTVPGYVDLAAAGDDVFLAFTGDTDRRDGTRAVSVTRSRDGVVWSAQVAIGVRRGGQAFEPRIVVGTSGEILVAWRLGLDGLARTVLRAVVSRDMGTRWSTFTDAPIEARGVYDVGLRAVDDRCGGLAASYVDVKGLRLVHFRARGTQTTVFASGRTARDAALATDRAGNVQLFWSNYHGVSAGDTVVRFEPMMARTRFAKTRR